MSDEYKDKWTPELFKEWMLKIANDENLDEEDKRRRMEMLMCGVLSMSGYSDGVRIFESTSKWYSRG